MPTIQVRTDDQTKIASTALFERLGITMSEAINLFLRQAVMRGGIPFALTITEERHETSAGILESEAFIDAIKRYKSINNKADFDVTKLEPLFVALEAIGSDKNMRMTLQENAAKVRLGFKGREYVLDYNFEEPDTVFILSRKDGKLFVKDCDLADIGRTLGLF